MNKPNLKTAQIVAIMLVVALVASLITYQYTIAGFQGNQEDLPFYVGAPQPYSYVIDTNDTHYFAFNGSTGFLEQTSTNASAVINNAIGNLTSGGKIFIKAGKYEISSSLTPVSHLTIEGEGPTVKEFGEATRLVLANGANCDIFKKTTGSQIIFFTVRDLTLDGNKNENTLGHGINFGSEQVADFCAENIYVTHFAEEAIEINGNWSPVLHRVIAENSLAGCIFYATQGSITESFFSVNNQYGIRLIGGPISFVCNGVWSNAQDGLQLYNCRGSQVVGNRFVGNSLNPINTYDGIAIVGTSYNNEIVGNNFYGYKDATQCTKYGVDIASTSYNNTIKSNTYIDLFDKWVNDLGSGNIIDFSRVRGVVPTFNTFDTNPSTPANMTDGDVTTWSGEGIKTLAAAGAVGYIIFDMGTSHWVSIGLVFNIHCASGDGTLALAVHFSDDGVTWFSGDTIISGITLDAECRGFRAILGYGRYFRFYVAAAGTTVSSVYHVNIAEVIATQVI